MKPLSILTSVSMICGGVVGFALSSPGLVHTEDTSFPPNPLGVKRSPYGEVFAMAMQGPIDTFFHVSQSNGTLEGEAHTHKHATNLAFEDEAYTGWNERLRAFIDGLAHGKEARTNHRGASAAHKLYLRRSVEDKLRFAYDLDPSHYGNYNAYHFFLTEPEMGTRPELTPTAAKLADETIAYCMAQRNDPRQALTAASAASNIIQLMLNDRAVDPESPRYSAEQMREVFTWVDHSINLYTHLAAKWNKEGVWDNFSELRRLETEERYRFIRKIRDSQKQAIDRLTNEYASSGVSNSAEQGHTVSNGGSASN